MAALLALALSAWAQPAAATAGEMPGQPTPAPLLLDDGRPDVDARAALLAWTDRGGQAGIVEAERQAAAAAFSALQPSAIHTLGATESLWLKLRVLRAPGAQREWLIEFPLPLLDAATLYQQDGRGGWRESSAGDTIPVAAWPEAGRYPFFRLQLPPGEVRDLYVKIRHVTPVTVPVRLASEPSHDHRLQMEYLLLGIVFGALILLILACAGQGWVHRDPVYGWYAVYASITTLAVAAYTGVAAHMLWPASGAWADVAQGSLALLAGGAALLFVRHLSGVSVRNPRFDRAVHWLGLAGLVLAPAYALAARPAALVVLVLYLTLAVALTFAVAALAWRRGDEVGAWMLAAYTPLAAAVLLTLLRVAGLLAGNWLTQYGVMLAMAAQVPLLLLALNVRSRERHGAEIREQALSSQDALTGLLAGHLFHDRLRQACARYGRDRESAAVIFIDLVNYARIKASHGQAAADQSLLRSVIKLRRLLRDVDTVSRIGESRFGLIMEGVSSRAVVTDRAARLIASGMMPLKGLKPDVTLQFHSAAALLGELALPPTELFTALEELLDGMSPRTRRPIRFLEPEVTRPMPLEADSQHDPDDAADSALPLSRSASPP